MSGLSPEFAKWKNHARQLQVKAIQNIAESGFELESEENSDQLRRLQLLALTPPTRLSALFDYFQETADDFYKETAIALRMSATQAIILGVFTMLTHACGETTSGTARIAIDSLKIIKAPLTEASFKDNGELVERATTEGRKEAVRRILQLTQGEIPLMMYRRDLLARIGVPLKPGKNDSYFTDLPTKIEGIDLNLWYAGSAKFPDLSFIVKPLL